MEHWNRGEESVSLTLGVIQLSYWAGIVSSSHCGGLFTTGGVSVSEDSLCAICTSIASDTITCLFFVSFCQFSGASCLVGYLLTPTEKKVRLDKLQSRRCLHCSYQFQTLPPMKCNVLSQGSSWILLMDSKGKDPI